MTGLATTTTLADPDALIERFDALYRDSQGDVTRVPWAHARANPCMVAWLNVEAPNLLRPGARVAVIGCGFGEDAAALADRGYDVTAFDACPSAIEHAKRRHGALARSFMVADLMDLPSRLHHRFDLAVEVHTLQALPPEHRPALAAGMADLLSHRGAALRRRAWAAHGRHQRRALRHPRGRPRPRGPQRDRDGLLPVRRPAPAVLHR
ncbi:MAG: class I SAM-dependent methyltransferase, partial [Planctomycetota bacterium]